MMTTADGQVTAAARAVLAAVQSDHALAPLLIAIGVRLAEDVDQADKIGERVQAVTKLLQVCEVLDGALFGHMPLPVADDGAPDEEIPDDPFAIGNVPPGVGDGSA